MPGDVSTPPMPATAALVAGGAGALVVGIALLIRGARNGRVILAVALAGVAAACSPLIVRVVPLDLRLTAAAAAVAGGLFAFLLGRLLWAGVLAAIVGAAALAAVAYVSAGGLPDPPSWPEPPPAVFGAWCQALGGHVQAWVRALWNAHRTLMVACMAGACVALAVGLLLPRATLVFASSVLGAVLVAGGAAGLCWAGRVQWAAQWLDRPQVPAAATGALAGLGLIFQTVTVLRGRARAKEEAPGEEPGQELL